MMLRLTLRDFLSLQGARGMAIDREQGEINEALAKNDLPKARHLVDALTALMPAGAQTGAEHVGRFDSRT